jgi:hypothetical protein
MPGSVPASTLAAIDRLMERASVALEATRYFDAERAARTALSRAHHAGDYERMARIVLPLQEARRQKRQLAVDASFLGREARGVTVIESRRAVPNAPAPGCYLFQPPLLGVDARAFRDAADAAETPIFILTREPLARDGLWPIVSVGPVVLRTKVHPPCPVQRVEAATARDDFAPAHAARISREWFEASAETLGDSAIRRLSAADPAAWRVDDALEFLEALPDHEKLHQSLAAACLQAMREPAPTMPRRRGVDDPFSF